jgi:hypothetical protein
MALDIAGLPGLLAALFFWLDKLSALFMIWWIGGKLSGKFKSKLTGLSSLVLRLVAGAAMYYLGIIVGTNFFSFLPGSIADISGALFVFLFFYLFTSLLTRGLAFRVVTRQEFTALTERIDKLEAMVNRVVEATTSKKIMPEKLSVKSAQNALKRVMKESKGVDEYVVLDSKTEKNIINFNVKCKVRSFAVSLDAFTGKMVEIKHLTDTPQNTALMVLNYFYERKAATLGAVLLVLFVNYLLLQSTQAVEERVATLLSFEPPESNDTFSLQDALGGLGFIPQGSLEQLGVG